MRHPLNRWKVDGQTNKAMAAAGFESMKADDLILHRPTMLAVLLYT